MVSPRSANTFKAVPFRLRDRMKFSANLSLLFADLPFLDRVGAAADAGFDAVEFWWPPDDVLEELPAALAEAGLRVVLFNFYAGDMAAGDRGLLADPDRVEEFRANLPIALRLAERLSCPRLNALVGLELAGRQRSEQLALATESIRWAADQAAPLGIKVMVEAVNSIENGPYLLTGTEAAREFIETVDRPNVELQYDVYHMQRMEGNLVDTLRQHIGLIGHIQIADSPGRGEPGTGEVNFSYVLREIERAGYRGYIGLEYRPAAGPATTSDGLSWVRDLGYRLGSQRGGSRR